MRGNVFRFELRLSRPAIFWCGLGVFLFQGLLVAFYAAADPSETLAGLFRLVPRSVKSLFGGEYVNLISIEGFLSFAFTHPLNLFLLCTPVIAMASRTASGGAAEGRTDLVLSQPISRKSLVASRMAAGTVAAAVLAGAMWLGHFAGTSLLPIPRIPPRPPFLYAAVNAFFFLLGVQGIAFLAAAAARERTRAVGAAIAVVAIMFLVRLAAQFFALAKILAAVSLFDYFIPGKVVAEASLPAKDILVLLAFCAVSSALAVAIFDRKDI